MFYVCYCIMIPVVPPTLPSLMSILTKTFPSILRNHFLRIFTIIETQTITPACQWLFFVGYFINALIFFVLGYWNGGALSHHNQERGHCDPPWTVSLSLHFYILRWHELQQHPVCTDRVSPCCFWNIYWTDIYQEEKLANIEIITLYYFYDRHYIHNF